MRARVAAHSRSTGSAHAQVSRTTEQCSTITAATLNDNTRPRIYMSVVLDFLKRFEVHSILLIIILGLIRQYAAPPLGPTMPTLISLDFEVHGKVQGVFFRKYTESKAKELELTGWCMNTKQGTVLGYMEGDKNKVEQMKDWLRHTGSPQSLIEKADFRNEKELDTPTLQTFSIKR